MLNAMTEYRILQKHRYEKNLKNILILKSCVEGELVPDLDGFVGLIVVNEDPFSCQKMEGSAR